MDLTASDLWLPGAAVQLSALLAAFGGVLAVTLPLAGWLWWRSRRAAVALEAVPDATTRPLAAVRLLVIAVLAVLVLPGAALIQQLWPHPELGRPSFLSWLAVLLLGMLAWLLLALADRRRER